VRVYRDYSVLWDMDGVLVDSGNLHRRAWRVFLARKGTYTLVTPRGYRSVSVNAITDELFRSGFGKPNTQVLPDFFGHDLPDEEIRALSDEKEACYRELIAQEGIEPTPGVRLWLQEFRDAGVRQALATSGCRANADLGVHLIGAEPYLEVVVTAEDVPRGKPYPDLFLRASELLGTPPSRCLVIEDSLPGVRAAQAAQMRCLALETTHPSDQIDGADLVLPDMRSFSWPLWQHLFAKTRVS